jgi:hypothetical protein
MYWGGVLGRVLMVASALVVDSAQRVVYVLGAMHGVAPETIRRLTNAKDRATDD